MEMTYTTRSGYVKPQRGACPHCHYIGPRQLCACQAELGRRLKAGDLEGALEQYELLKERANEDLQARTVWTRWS